MAATPQYGTFTFRGARSGKIYNVDSYISDVNAAPVRFDGGSGAGSTSPDYWVPPEPVTLTDFAIVTGTVDTTKIALQVGNNPTGNILRYALYLTTLAFRSSLRLGLPPGTQFRAQQMT